MKGNSIYLKDLRASGSFNFSITAMYEGLNESATTINVSLTLEGKIQFLSDNSLKDFTSETFNFTLTFHAIYYCLKNSASTNDARLLHRKLSDISRLLMALNRFVSFEISILMQNWIFLRIII